MCLFVYQDEITFFVCSVIKNDVFFLVEMLLFFFSFETWYPVQNPTNPRGPIPLSVVTCDAMIAENPFPMLVLLVLFVDDAIFTLEELNICET
jgi:hypothetical protein